MKALPERSSRLLKLRYFENNNCGEVAEKFSMNLNAIYKRLSRLHHGLKECIELRLQKQGAQEP